MKLSERWLREWVDPPIDAQALATQLTGAGLEVAGFEPVAGDMQGVVVGEVLSVAPHPNADRLSVCRVSIGGSAVLEVVCGAPNVHAGMRAPYVPVGGTVAGGRQIRASRIRGVQSHGMLCSPVELGLGEDADGLLELPADASPGEPLTALLALDDLSIDVELTPNRGDCLSVLGVAREIGVLNAMSVTMPALEPVAPALPDALAVSLEAPAECPKYAGRIIRHIDARAGTPVWMIERLRRSGVRSISAVVDVTNYVMLELGQPLHAFDLDRLQERIRVRFAEPGETLTLLDEQVVTLDADMLVIADECKAVALAGIMGGLDTGVVESSTQIFLESAYFEPRHVAGDAKRCGLHTDASHRFERGVDPHNQRRAVERATALLLEIVGGEPGAVVEAVSEEHMPVRAPVVLRRARLARLLGAEVDDKRVVDALERLGMTLEGMSDGWRVTPPAFRFDIEIEADLIEEVARIIGYDNLPTRPPSAALAIRPHAESRVDMQAYRNVLVERGYREAITYSFVSSRLERLLGVDEQAIALNNPISAEMDVMRTTLWPGLLGAMLHNAKRQQRSVRLFETGLVFARDTGRIRQTRSIAGLAAGPPVPVQWDIDTRECDFFDVKSDVENLLSLGNGGMAHRFEPMTHAALHPGQSARIERDAVPVGVMGMLHPRITRSLKHAGRVVVFELNLDDIASGRVPRYESLSRFPAMRRDISIVIDEQITAQRVRDCVGQMGIDVLQNLELFDVYYGEGIDSGKKSFALSLTFQSSSRTLNDEEVDSFVVDVVDRLAAKLGAGLRS